MKKFIRQFLYKKERGQAIILVAAGLIGLIAMVGLVIDTGLLFIEYGKLKRGVDAASIAAAQQFRSVSGEELDPVSLIDAAKNFLQLNETGVDPANITVHSCAEDPGTPGRPVQCNPDPEGNPDANRKLVEVSASKFVEFSFLRILGIKGTTISTISVGEAATMDLVMVIDTSASMAFQTTGDLKNPQSDPGSLNPTPPHNPGDDPIACNAINGCMPMKEVKKVAGEFIETMYFPYDRVAIITMTGQTIGGDRNPVTILPLTSDKDTVKTAIENIKVWQPRECVRPQDLSTAGTGTCLIYSADEGDPDRIYTGQWCPVYELNSNDPDANPSSCNSSNVGGALLQAADALSKAAHPRPDAFWVVIGLFGGPANSTDSYDGFPFGYCPRYTWIPDNIPWCRDRFPRTTRHTSADKMDWVNPKKTPEPSAEEISIYDADDYARDAADSLAALTSETGVTIYTIGLGKAIDNVGTSDDTYADGTKIPPARELLQYIAQEAGDASGTNVTHGEYFFAPTSDSLSNIFELIANNIATRISQ